MNDTIIDSTCGYCSTGCNLSVQVAGGRPVKVNARPDYPVNHGKACPKGFQFLGHLDAADRALHPYLRDARGKLVPIDWDTALQLFTDNFKSIQKQHGDESVIGCGL